MKETEEFAYGLEDEYFEGRGYPTRAAAISAAKAAAFAESRRLGRDIPAVYTGKVATFVPRIDGDQIIDQLKCDAEEEAGEFAEYWLADVSKPQSDRLGELLSAAFTQWAQETDNLPDFYVVYDIRRHNT